MLLIAGGNKDHNLVRIADAAADRKYPFRMVHHNDSKGAPRVCWDMAGDELQIDGESFRPAGASVFIRYDVFDKLTDPTSVDADYLSSAWFEVVKGWAVSYPEIGILNRDNEAMEYNKLRGLVMAREAGFIIPETYATNDFGRFADKSAYIAKPIAGGSATRMLDEIDSDKAPVFAQEKLLYPELRVYRVGKHYFGFSIGSKTLDSRDDHEQTITEEKIPPALQEAMRVLTDRMGLDYAAADFKTCPKGRGFLFLEINTMPFLTGYDNAVSGRLSDAILLLLIGKAQAAGHKTARCIS